MWWQWDARLTMALLLELIFVGYCSCGSTAARDPTSWRRPWRSSAWPTSPFVYMSVDIWRTVHPEDHRRADASARDAGAFLVLRALAFMLLFRVAAALRVRLDTAQRRLDELYLADEDSAA